MLIEPNELESLEPISFRGSSEDKAIMRELSGWLGCTPSAVIRVALRVLRDLLMLPRVVEVGYRCTVNTVLRRGDSV